MQFCPFAEISALSLIPGIERETFQKFLGHSYVAPKTWPNIWGILPALFFSCLREDLKKVFGASCFEVPLKFLSKKYFPKIFRAPVATA